MTDGINSVIVQGELFYPELKYTGSGKALFKAKVKIPSLDQHTGEERACFLRITAWEEFAEYLGSLAKGANIKASGRIQERSFENREGKKQSVTDIVIDGVEEVTSDEGLNQFVLQGEVVWPDFKQVGERQSSLFKSKVKIPFYREDDPSTLRHAYVRITAWDENADGLSGVAEGQFVKVSGHIQDRSWTNPETGQKRTFTDSIVTNYTLVNAGAA